MLPNPIFSILKFLILPIFTFLTIKSCNLTFHLKRTGTSAPVLQSRNLKFYTPEYAENPASIGSMTPVTALAARSSHKKNTPPNSSLLSTNRPAGVPAKIFLERAVGCPFSSNKSARFWLDTKKPGAIALQRILLPAKWCGKPLG